MFDNFLNIIDWIGFISNIDCSKDNTNVVRSTVEEKKSEIKIIIYLKENLYLE